MPHTVFGIRHHGPGSARSLQRALQALQPDTVLIEGAFLTIGVGLGLNSGPLLSVAVAAAPKEHAGVSPVDADRIVAGLHPAFVGGAIGEFIGALAAWRWIPRDALRAVQ